MWCHSVCYCVVKCRCAQVKWESASEVGGLPEAGQSEEGGEFRVSIH